MHIKFEVFVELQSLCPKDFHGLEVNLMVISSEVCIVVRKYVVIQLCDVGRKKKEWPLAIPSSNLGSIEFWLHDFEGISQTFLRHIITTHKT